MLMRSAGYALSWEFWRRGVFWFVPACAALVVGLMAPPYCLLVVDGHVPSQLNHAAFAVVCWAPLVLAIASRGALQRLYTLPVSTQTLVAWTLTNGAAAVAVTYWLVAMSFNSPLL
jgi:hypothetical protein